MNHQAPEFVMQDNNTSQALKSVLYAWQHDPLNHNLRMKVRWLDWANKLRFSQGNCKPQKPTTSRNKTMFCVNYIDQNWSAKSGYFLFSQNNTCFKNQHEPVGLLHRFATESITLRGNCDPIWAPPLPHHCHSHLHHIHFWDCWAVSWLV